MGCTAATSRPTCASTRYRRKQHLGERGEQATSTLQCITGPGTQKWDSTQSLEADLVQASGADAQQHTERPCSLSSSEGVSALSSQGRFISWAHHRQPGAANYTKDAWSFDNAPTALPGHPDALQVPCLIGSIHCGSLFSSLDLRVRNVITHLGQCAHCAARPP